ncbi:FAD-dependent oxidoreductase [Tsukamurella sp. 8F]|uniref:FAD-dependent oxidoreductase n=1 Tax=unclassified Tsukamurella TaxID=2633480 RepID=UPI0023BA0625|nr:MULTISPECIES: FAD-dependent oxidoreductase [unclassified Tsukamurella]MDF0531083.1 FAD-dependent oxidoreductase [Tsukamurella sp. 8J]MDF0585450.1 FAD-dependent oxidoreductase [Tsukamurella sp. 8F]
MDLSADQRATLAAIVDTFAPGDGVAIPAATAIGTVGVALDLVDRSPHYGDDDGGLRSFLSTWDNRIFATAVLGTRGRLFRDLSQAERERILIDLAQSRFEQKRVLFKRIRSLSVMSYYVAPGSSGYSPVWQAIGFPPAPHRKRLRGRAQRALKPLSPTRYEIDASAECDVVVIGSGPGGSAAASVLTEAGLDVMVLEKGDYHAPPDHLSTEFHALTDLYAGSPFLTDNAQTTLLAGECLGGSSVVGYAGCFRPSEQVRADWGSRGLPMNEDFDAALEAVWRRLDVTSSGSSPSTRDELLEKGCRELGLGVRTVPRAVEDCDHVDGSGRCLNCRLGGKRTTTATWLRDAERRGARIVTGVDVRSIDVGDGRARRVVARTSGGSWLTVECRAVVVAAGAIQTPALLRRSGIGGPHVGRHLHLHPTATAFGVFDGLVAPWSGTMTARYCDDHADLDGAGFGVLYDTAPATPALAASFAPWRGANEHLNIMRQLPHLSHVRIVTRDRGSGEVTVDRSGEPTVKYNLSEADRRHVRHGIDTAVRILEGAGARRIFTGHQRGGDYVPGVRSREAFLRGEHDAGYGPGELALMSQEAMGTARMGSAERHSAADPEGALWDVPNVVIADASMLPSAAGVHPMASIAALAILNAQALAGRLQ